MSSIPVMCYDWPADAALVRYRYWRPAQAATVWGCSYQSARRWLLRHPEHAIMVQLRMPSGLVRSYLCMLAGQARTVRQGGPGNPTWHDGSTQSALARRRWQRRRGATPPDPDAPQWD